MPEGTRARAGLYDAFAAAAHGTVRSLTGSGRPPIRPHDGVLERRLPEPPVAAPDLT